MRNPFTSLKEKFIEYLQLRYEIVRLELIEKIINVLSYLVFTLITLFLMFTAILFLGFGTAIWLSDLMHSNFAGYFATFGIIAIFAMIVFWRAKYIINYFGNKILESMSANFNAQKNAKKRKQEGTED